MHRVRFANGTGFVEIDTAVQIQVVLKALTCKIVDVSPHDGTTGSFFADAGKELSDGTLVWKARGIAVVPELLAFLDVALQKDAATFSRRGAYLHWNAKALVENAAAVGRTCIVGPRRIETGSLVAHSSVEFLP